MKHTHSVLVELLRGEQQQTRGLGWTWDKGKWRPVAAEGEGTNIWRGEISLSKYFRGK